MLNRKIKTALLLSAIMTLQAPISTYALTPYDVYKTFSLPYRPSLSNNAMDVITNYNDGVKQVVNTFEKEHISDNAVSANNAKLKKRLKEIEKQLDNGAELTLDEICELEDEYVTTRARIKTGSSNPITVSSSTVSSGEFKKAMQEYDTYKSVDITKHPLSPISDNPKPLDPITALFDGEVESCDKGNITIVSRDNIKVVYSNLFYSFVQKGDTVSANSKIANATKNSKVTLKINNKDYDWRKVVEDKNL